MAHMTETDEHELIDMGWWKTSAATTEWAQFLGREDAVATAELRASTYAGRPWGLGFRDGGRYAIWSKLDTRTPADRRSSKNRNSCRGG
jgi:hypothetical protein